MLRPTFGCGWSKLFVCALFGALAIPLLWNFSGFGTSAQKIENREASPLPPIPQSWSEAPAWPRLADAYLSDHFGGRMIMIRTFNWISYKLFGEMPSNQILLGGRGRIFLTSHTTANPYSLIRFICGDGVEDVTIDKAVTELQAFWQSARSANHANNYLMVVPTAPVLYFDDLPSWLRARCAPANTVDRVILRLPEGDLRRRLLYPLQAMLAAKTHGEVIPLTNFHWDGLGAQVAAMDFAERMLGLRPSLTLPTHVVTKPSDIAHLMPGVPTGNSVRLPDFAASGIDYCAGATCFPELGPIAELISDLSRLRSPKAGDKRLLILSDSFGAAIVGWFAPYFASVYHLSVSNLGRLSTKERNILRGWIFDRYQPDVVLYVFHDGSVHYWPHIAAQGLWGGGR